MEENKEKEKEPQIITIRLCVCVSPEVGVMFGSGESVHYVQLILKFFFDRALSSISERSDQFEA
jgi:hypothetical protein